MSDRYLPFYFFAVYFFLHFGSLFILHFKVGMMRRRILREYELEKEFRVQRMRIDPDDRRGRRTVLELQDCEFRSSGGRMEGLANEVS